MRRQLIKALSTAPLLGLTRTTWSQGFPNRTVRIVVPYPPGALTDIIPRMVAERLRDQWGQPVIVENRPGGGGRIAAEYVSRSPGDGYTLFVGLPDQLAIAPSLYKAGGKFDPERDFVPVTIMLRQAFILVVNSKLPIHSTQEYIRVAKAKPGGITLASWGEGSAGHVALELLKSASATDILHVPYRGAQAAINAVASGEVDSMITGYSTATPFLQSGHIRLLATTASKRSEQRPDVPTIAEAGYPEYEVQSWYSLVAPRGTPRDVVDIIQQSVAVALRSPNIIERIRSYNAELLASTPDEFSSILTHDLNKWSKVIRDAKIQLD